MTDVFTKEKRSWLMSRIKSKWTKQEKLAHNYLKGNKIKHVMHPKMIGSPDIILPDEKIAIFLHGCFWHKCPLHYRAPKSKIKFWNTKIENNVLRDSRNIKLLRRHGWKVVKIWEHEINENPPNFTRIIEKRVTKMQTIEEKIKAHLNKINLRKHKNTPGVYFEQKITPDLIWFTAASIINVTNGDINKTFTDSDIRSSQSFKKFIHIYFSKPEPTEKTESEYNKLTSYQLGLLSFAGILQIVGNRPKKYKIKELEILNYISQNELNALFFLENYVEKLLNDNNLLEIFNIYKSEPNQKNYENVKSEFWKWARQNTNVRTSHPHHSYRVFNKIFNLFAHTNSLPGQESSNVREGICPYNYLRYNRLNFRDVSKPKIVSRKEYEKTSNIRKNDEQLLQYMIAKAKEEIRNRHTTNEVTDPNYTPGEMGRIDIHHIFLETQYPKFAAWRENLISLMAGQHQAYSHKEGTRYVNEKFQIICLLAKLKSIEDSLKAKDNFYNLKNFIEMLNAGLKLGIPDDADVDSIRHKLEEIKKKFD